MPQFHLKVLSIGSERKVNMTVKLENFTVTNPYPKQVKPNQEMAEEKMQLIKDQQSLDEE